MSGVLEIMTGICRPPIVICTRGCSLRGAWAMVGSPRAFWQLRTT